MYGDDTHIRYAGSDLDSIQTNLKGDLDNPSKWLISNRLKLNTTKTEFKLMGFRHKLSTQCPSKTRLYFKSLGVLMEINAKPH